MQKIRSENSQHDVHLLAAELMNEKVLDNDPALVASAYLYATGAALAAVGVILDRETPFEGLENPFLSGYQSMREMMCDA